MAFIFPLILGMSSSQLTNSHFSEGLRPPTGIIYIYTSLKHPQTKGRKDNITVMMYVYIYIFTMYTYKPFVFGLILSNHIVNHACDWIIRRPLADHPSMLTSETITLHSWWYLWCISVGHQTFFEDLQSTIYAYIYFVSVDVRRFILSCYQTKLQCD